jgi:hypothetical protein
MNWDADFAGLPPVTLPEGRELATLADCRTYIDLVHDRRRPAAGLRGVSR